MEPSALSHIAKPFNRDELLARVCSLLRVKRYHDTVKELNRTLCGPYLTGFLTGSW